MQDLRLLVIVSDLHVNSTIALCPRRFRTEYGIREPNKAQEWLIDCWIDFWTLVETWKFANPTGKVVTVFSGDLLDLNYHNGFEVITNDPSKIINATIDVMELPLALSDYHFVCRGTPAHSGKSGWAEDQVAKETNAVPETDPDGNVLRHSWYNLALETGGVLSNIQHHPGTRSGREWTIGGAACRVAAKATMNFANTTRKPQLVVRSHNHRYEDSGANYHPIMAIITPAWQLATEFVYRIGAGDGELADIGGLMIECQGGEYKYNRPVLYEPERGEPCKV